jgi:poly(3-hydroxybutyrate) depolymerase
MFSKVSGWRLVLVGVAVGTACSGRVATIAGDHGQGDAGNGASGRLEAGATNTVNASEAGAAQTVPAGGKGSVGGMSSLGGITAVGGVTSADAGSPDGGASDAPAAANPGLNKAWKSSGCGLALPAQQVATIVGSRTGYTEWQVQQSGATLGTNEPSKAGPRQFFVRVPATYDPSKPYRVVYVGQGCGAQHAGKTNTYPLFNEAQGGSEQAVYVALSVPDDAVNPGCYDNNTGSQSEEWEAFDLIHTFVESHYCVDNNRIYVAGYSPGAWVANMWGCYFGGTASPALDEPDVAAGRTERKFAPHWAIRGAAGVAGSLPPNQPLPCNGPAAHFWLHDALDKSTLLANEITALNLALKTNGCTGNYTDGPKKPWAPAENIPALAGGVCQQYTGCPAGTANDYPLVFCTTSSFGHADQAASAIPAFSRFFELMEPTP